MLLFLRDTCRAVCMYCMDGRKNEWMREAKCHVVYKSNYCFFFRVLFLSIDARHAARCACFVVLVLCTPACFFLYCFCTACQCLFAMVFVLDFLCMSYYYCVDLVCSSCGREYGQINAQCSPKER